MIRSHELGFDGMRTRGQHWQAVDEPERHRHELPVDQKVNVALVRSQHPAHLRRRHQVRPVEVQVDVDVGTGALVGNR